MAVTGLWGASPSSDSSTASFLVRGLGRVGVAAVGGDGVDAAVVGGAALDGVLVGADGRRAAVWVHGLPVPGLDGAPGRHLELGARQAADGVLAVARQLHTLALAGREPRVALGVHLVGQGVDARVPGAERDGGVGTEGEDVDGGAQHDGLLGGHVAADVVGRGCIRCTERNSRTNCFGSAVREDVAKVVRGAK